jgi:2,3-bisphosphoglycerate-dependent phosphoglycerate mutase
MRWRKKMISYDLANLDPVVEFVLEKNGAPTEYAKELNALGSELKLGSTLKTKPLVIKNISEILPEDQGKAKLVLVRHGQSTWNLEERFTGWVDVHLTPQGEAQAKLAGELIKGLKIDETFTSTLVRAYETLQFVAKGAGLDLNKLPLTKHKALNERHYGELQGLNKVETKEKHGEEKVLLWRRSYDARMLNNSGESLEMTIQRVLPYFNRAILGKINKGETLLITAHGNSLRGIEYTLEGMTPDQVVKHEIANGEPHIYVFGPGLTVDRKYIIPLK